MKSSGLAHNDMCRFDMYMATDTMDKRLIITATRALTYPISKRGIEQLKRDIPLFCLLCEPGSVDGKLKYCTNNFHYDHYHNFHKIKARNVCGRCHFPGYDTIWSVPKTPDTEVERKRDNHLQTSPHRPLLFPDEP